MHLKDLKKTVPADLVTMAEELGVEGASTLRKQDLMFAILKAEAENGAQIMGEGTIEVLPDGFGFLRSPEANFLAGPDDIYVSPNQVRRFGLRTGDTVEGEIRAPKDGERYFALTKLLSVNFDDPDVVRHRVNFDNLTPLYPEQKLRLDTLDPTIKDKSARVIDIVSPQGKGQRALIVAPPRTGKTVQVGAQQSLLHALKAEGVAVPSSCESGTCGSCKVRLLAGEADHRDLVLMDEEKRDHIMVCVSRACSDDMVLDL